MNRPLVIADCGGDVDDTPQASTINSPDCNSLSRDSFVLRCSTNRLMLSIDSKSRRAMKVGHLQFLSRLQNPQFDTLKRRGHVSFLERDVGKGVDRFRNPHALALAAFECLRRVGTQPAIACQAVNDSWQDIRTICGDVYDEAYPLKSELCGVRINHLNIVDTWGYQHHGSRDGQEPVLSNAVNLKMLWEWLQPDLAKLQ